MLQSGDAPPAGEDRGDLAGAVGDHDLQVRKARPRRENDPRDLTGHPDRDPQRQLAEGRQAEAAEPILQPRLLELGDRGVEPGPQLAFHPVDARQRGKDQPGRSPGTYSLERPVKSSLAPLEGNKVKLSVNIGEDEFDRDIDQAFRKIAREVRLPGFRAGKAPRRVLEARIGVAPAREQALRDSIPTYLARAVREHDVDLIATPEVEITGGAEEGPVDFDATCEVRPEVTVPGYGGLRVELPNPDPGDEEVEEALAAQLRRHGTLVDVERPVARGDYVTLDLVTTRDGEEVPGSTRRTGPTRSGRAGSPTSSTSS